jgi:hypothetical protein
LHGYAVLADVACDNGRRPGRAAGIFPHNLSGHFETTALGRPFVTPRLLPTLHETETLFHWDFLRVHTRPELYQLSRRRGRPADGAA